MGDCLVAFFMIDMDTRIILKGGTIVRDGKQTKADVAVCGSVIERIAPEIVPSKEDKVFDCSRKIITVGLVDPTLSPHPTLWRICSSR